jgi:hypothetical protein
VEAITREVKTELALQPLHMIGDGTEEEKEVKVSWKCERERKV